MICFGFYLTINQPFSIRASEIRKWVFGRRIIIYGFLEKRVE